MNSRGRPRQFERSEALVAAMTVFWERGYEGASIDELTAAMGINRPSLYAAFGCKESLFRDAVELYDHVEGEPIAKAVAAARSVRDAVEAYLRVNAEAYCSLGKPAGCLIVLAALAGSPGSAEIREFLASIRRDGQRELEALLQRGIEHGELRADADIGAIAKFYITVLQGMSIQSRDGASLAELTAVIHCAMTAWPALTEQS